MWPDSPRYRWPPVPRHPPPARAAPPAGELPARVRVETDRIRRTIPDDLFGTNIEVIRDANGLWEPRRNRFEPDILRLAREMGVTLVRFPGGVWSDAYDWRNGIGPRSARATTPTHPGGEERFRHVVGTDEMLDFVQQIGGRLLLTVNAGTGNAAMAAEWVRYVNGDGGRSPRNGRVRDWQIGNELYIEGDASGGHMPPERYAALVTEYARAMRAVDPGIRIGAIGLRNFARYRLNRYDNWNEVLLRRASADFDVLTVHNAYSPLVGDGRGLDPAEVYAAMWAFPRQVAQNLADTRADIARFAPARAAQIGIGVTEWGPLFAIDPASPWIDHMKTMGSAIYVASVLATMAEEPALVLANFFKLNEASFMGWIGRRGSRWAPTASWHVFRLMARGMERGLLANSVEVATYASRRLGFVERMTGVPYLDSLATASADGATLTVLLINKHPSATLATQVSLAGASGAASLSSETVTAGSIDANTGTELPRLPGLRWAEQARTGARGRFHLGAEDEIRIETASLGPVSAQTMVRVPPHSVMLLRFEGVRRP